MNLNDKIFEIMETTDQTSTPMSENEFESLMSKFSNFLQQNQKLNKPKITASPPQKVQEHESTQYSVEIKTEEFSQIYHQKEQDEISHKKVNKKTQKVEKIIDELEKLLQTIENYHSK